MAKITYDDKAIGSKWRAVDANEVKESVNDLYDGIPGNKASLTNFRYQIASISESDNKYTGWPYGCLFYDESIDRVVQVYSAKNGHVGTTGIVYIRTIDYKNELDWSARVAIADRSAESLVATCHAAGICDNGDYVAIVRFTNGAGVIQSTYLYRSTDQGATWNGSQWVDSGASPLNPEEAGSIFKTASGALLTYFRDGAENYVYRSTDDGVTWNGHSVVNSLGGTPLEGAFVQIPSGAIVAVVRATATLYPFITKAAAVYTVSNDDGVTWSSLATTNIEDMTNSPAGLLYHAETDTIEIIYGSRYAQTDGYASLWQAETTPENLVLGVFNAPTRLAIGVSNSSFGYPAICKTEDGHVVTGYYNGTDNKTVINYMVGRRSESPQGASLESYNLLRNPATYEAHADFLTPIDAADRSSMGLKNLSYLNFATLPSQYTTGGFWLSALNNTTRNVERLSAETFIYNGSTLQTPASFRIDSGRMDGGAEVFKISTKTGAADHALMGIYARTANPTTRSGYVGYLTAGAQQLTLGNEISGSDVALLTTGAGRASAVSAGFQVTPNAATTQNWDVSIGQSGSFNQLVFTTSADSFASGAQVRGSSYRGTLGSKTATLLNDLLLTMSGYGQTGASASSLGAQIRIRAAENFSPTANGTFITFGTVPIGSTSFVDGMRLMPSGSLMLQDGGTFTDVSSSRLTITSTTQGFLPPRMSTTQRNAISSPAAGLMIYNTTTNKLNVYTTVWEAVTSA